MEKKSKKFDPKKLIVLLAVFVLLVSTAFAWFVYTLSPITNTFTLSNFQTDIDCYFLSGNTRTETTNYIDSDTNVIDLSLNSADANYFANFHVDVKYKGEGYGYLRVKVVTEAKDSLGYSTLMDSKPPYVLSAAYDNVDPLLNGNDQEAWFDNRNKDFCFYYASELTGNNDTFSTLQVISGAQTSNTDSGFDLDYLRNNGYTLAVAVSCEMVQINRYPQFWGMNKLPWKL